MKLILLTIFVEIISPKNLNEPFADKKYDKIYYIKPTLDIPVIDGVIDEILWDEIIPISDFLQEEPINMVEPSEETKVYITYNKQTLYIAAKLFDSFPEDIVRILAPKDDWYGAFDDQADWFSIDLDSRHDHQTAFSFAVNASGVMSDEMVYNDTDFDSDWNAIWDAAVKITDFGWVVEMEIPFSMLPFNEGYELIWGLNITRFIQRKYETITWVAFPLEVEGIASKYGHLTGLKGIFPPAKFEFSPYSLGGFTNYSDLKLLDIDDPLSHKVGYMDESNFNFGLDMKYRINPNSHVTLAVNPDFGQVESDPADINLTSYETYFPEKRPFFLENSTLFKTPIEVFYSRRIGQDEFVLEKDRNGQEIWELRESIIKGAGKFNGKNSSGFSYGIMGAITELSNSHFSELSFITDSSKIFSIARIKQDLFQGNSFVGALMTLGNDQHTSNYSIDGLINIYDNTIGIDGQLVLKKNRNEEINKGIYTSLSYNPLGYFSYWIDYQLFDKI